MLRRFCKERELHIDPTIKGALALGQAAFF